MLTLLAIISYISFLMLITLPSIYGIVIMHIRPSDRDRSPIRSVWSKTRLNSVTAADTTCLTGSITGKNADSRLVHSSRHGMKTFFMHGELSQKTVR